MDFRVANLGCRRGQSRILKGVTFQVQSGRALILRGPNGSGKTTLLRTLAGLTPPIEGSLSLPFDAIAYSGHADGVKAQMTVIENLHFWARVFGTEDTGAAIDMYDLGGLLARQAQNLSAGQKRRLGLARMMVTGRPVWAMDEPTVSLDAANVAVFARMTGAHLAKGGSAIIATHVDLGLDRAEVLDISPFRADTGDAGDPFLDGDFR
ncbi:MAG: heme ABC exporter ATP-binding protein CcmA [Paracoccaceae bacterium]